MKWKSVHNGTFFQIGGFSCKPFRSHTCQARINSYLDDNYTGELNLEELAGVFYMS